MSVKYERERSDILRAMDQKTIGESEKDIRFRRIIIPAKVLWKQGNVINEQALLEKNSMQITLKSHDACIMESKGEKASVVLDFGYEIHGGIRILAWIDSTRRGAKVRVRFGESAAEAMSELGGETNATNDHASRDILTEIGSMSMNPIGETGFRFVRLDLEETDATLILKSVTAELVYKDVPYRGSFTCSDDLLNRIWDVGAYTVHLNMQEYIWDGIKRDRLVWVGDMHPEVMSVRTVFGRDSSVEKSLDFIREETPLPGWMNEMAAYSMWYAVIVYDWYLYTGDIEFLSKQKDYLAGILNQLSASIDENGKDTVTQGRFLDWPSNDNPPVVDAGVQAIHYLAVSGLEKIFHALGDEELEGQCSADLEKLRKYEADYLESKQAAALLVLAGLKDAHQVNEGLLKKGGAKGMSTFMGYYILAARSMAGDYQGCLDCVREYWGGMLKLGATTFWEDFDIDWAKGAAPIDRLPEPGETDVHGTYGGYCYKGYRHSLCHGWASGATPWLSEYVLGIQVLEPGCKKVRIAPQLGDLSWAKGTFPTPYGDIKVYHEKREDGSIMTQADAPEEVTVVYGDI